MKKLLTGIFLIMLAITVGACGVNNEANQGSTNSNSNVENSAKPSDNQQSAETDTEDNEQAKATVYPLTVEDASGAELTFEQAPQRIVSTSSSETEILFALGLGDRIYGVSDYDNYPEEALSKPKIGGVYDPNEEVLLATQPDLVIGGISMQEDMATRLRQIGIKLYKTEPENVEDALAIILQLGVITDTQVKAEEIVAQMREDIRKVTEAAASIKDEDRKKVYIEFAPGWTVGSGEFMDELITMAGGVNIAGTVVGWHLVNEEKIVQDNPDVILYAADLIDYDSGNSLRDIIKKRSGWSTIKAIKEDQLIGLNEDIMSRTGPRLSQALLLVSEAIYPGLVK